MFENIINFFKKSAKNENKTATNSKSKNAAKERLHLVLMQDRANVSADFLELMKQEIIDVIKKYIDIDESAIDVRLTNKENDDGTNGAPALYANIPIVNIKNDLKKAETKIKNNEEDKRTKKDEKIKDDDKIEEKSNDKNEVVQKLEQQEQKEQNEEYNKGEDSDEEVTDKDKDKEEKDKITHDEI